MGAVNQGPSSRDGQADDRKRINRCGRRMLKPSLAAKPTRHATKLLIPAHKGGKQKQRELGRLLVGKECA
jgi:hypothetical protein